MNYLETIQRQCANVASRLAGIFSLNKPEPV